MNPNITHTPSVETHSKTVGHEKELHVEVIILMRHGDYSMMGLTPRGREQVERVARAMFPYVKGKDIQLVTSPVKRAVDSAEIVATALDTSFEVKAFLKSKGGTLTSQNIDGALSFLRKATVHVVIFSTHLEFCEDFPEIIDARLMRLKKMSAVTDMPRGAAWVIDCKTGECVLIP